MSSLSLSISVCPSSSLDSDSRDFADEMSFSQVVVNFFQPISILSVNAGVGRFFANFNISDWASLVVCVVDLFDIPKKDRTAKDSSSICFGVKLLPKERTYCLLEYPNFKKWICAHNYAVSIDLTYKL